MKILDSCLATTKHYLTALLNYFEWSTYYKQGDHLQNLFGYTSDTIPSHFFTAKIPISLTPDYKTQLATKYTSTTQRAQ